LAAAAQEEWLCKGVGKEAAAAEQSRAAVSLGNGGSAELLCQAADSFTQL
jgi:hypothetical protein